MIEERWKMFSKSSVKDLSEISKKLNLLYYEYDKYQNKFMVDSRYNKETTYNELIKLTYELSKQNIGFFRDEDSNIVISSECNLFSPIKQRIKNISYAFKSYRKNIYTLSDKEVKHARNLPIIETKAIEKVIDLSPYDALIFTSKNGVKYCDSLTSEWKKIPAYAISTQTAKQIKDLKGKIAFVGKEKHGDEFAYELLEHLKGKRVAYIGAEKIVSNLMAILKEHNIACDYIAVYRTVCRDYEEKIKLPSGSIIIFSSPSTIECFLKNVEWDKSFTAISIGRTTAKYFPDTIEPLIADNTSLESCVYKALSL
jgi:uroporphyrinogen-III synthase